MFSFWLRLTCCFAWSVAIAEQTWRAGFSVVDVTPLAEELNGGGFLHKKSASVYLGGYGFLGLRDGGILPTPAKGIHDPVSARTVVLTSSASTSIVITVIDAPGMDNKLLRRIREGASNSISGLSLDNILVCLTHTHSGPDLQGLWGSVPDWYKDRVVEGGIASIQHAWDQQTEAKLYVSNTTGTAVNRRGWNMTDDEITVLDVRNATDGSSNSSRLGTLVNFAAHPTTIGPQNSEFSSDYPHYLRKRMEDTLDTTVVFVNGAVGDVLPLGDKGGFSEAESYGNLLADTALASMEEAEQRRIDSTAELVVQTFYWDQICNNFLLRFAVKSGIVDYDYVKSWRWWPNLLPMLDIYFPTRATYFRIGDVLQGVAVPGESTTRNALPIKQAMVAPYKLFLGLSGDSLGYFVPSDEWNEGGTEERTSVDQFAGDDLQAILLDLMSKDR